MRTLLPPVACVVSFVDAINHGNVEHLGSLMSSDHRLQVLDEVPIDGRGANLDAWHGYASAFPDYVVYPQEIIASGTEVLVCGHTTGSHLGLRDEDESQLAVIWRAEVTSGLLTLWQIIEDTPARRQASGSPLDPGP